MNRQITRLAVVGVVLMISLVVATTYWQTWAAPGLADRQDNAIELVAQFTIKRGEITNHGRVLARNRTREVDGRTLYFRRYPQGKLTAHIVGYSTRRALPRGARALHERLPDGLELEPLDGASTGRSTG